MKKEPRLRFQNEEEPFPSWRKGTLGHIAIFCGGGTPSKSNMSYWEGNIPWVSSSDMSEEKINRIRISRYITEEAVAQSATKICPPGSILIVTRVGVGKVGLTDREICTSQDFTNIISTNANRSFLAHYVAKKMHQLATQSQGTSIKGVTTETLKNLEISVPSLPEQTKIANFLSLVDSRIEKQEQKVESLEEYKKGLMQKIFAQEIRFKGDDGEEFPEWEEISSSELFSTVTDYVAGGSFASLKDNVVYRKEGYAQLVRTIDLKNNFQNADKVYVDHHSYKFLHKVNLDKVSIVLSNVGNVGEVYYINPVELPHKANVLGPNAILVRSDVCINKVLFYLLSTSMSYQKIMSIVSTTGQPKFNKTDFKKLSFCMPIDKKEQTKIANFLSGIDRKIDKEKELLEAMKEMKKGLLQQMFV